MAIANLAVRFITELGGIAAVAYAGFQIGGPLPLRAVVAVGLALLLVATWALVVAPNTANGLSPIQKDLIGSVILLLAAGALAVAGQPALAIGFAAVVAVNTALLLLLGTDARDGVAGMAR